MVKRSRIIGDLDTVANRLPLSLHTLQTLHTCYAVTSTLAFHLFCEESLRVAMLGAVIALYAFGAHSLLFFLLLKWLEKQVWLTFSL